MVNSSSLRIECGISTLDTKNDYGSIQDGGHNSAWVDRVTIKVETSSVHWKLNKDIEDRLSLSSGIQRSNYLPLGNVRGFKFILARF